MALTPEQMAEARRIRAAKFTEAKDRQNFSKTFDNLSPLDQFGVGIAKPFVQLYDGLTGNDSPEANQRQMAMQEADSGWSTGGEIAADVAMLALPAGAVFKGAKALTPNAGALTRTLATVAGETGLNAAYEGAKAPEQGETRADNAGTAAAWTAALGIPMGYAANKFVGTGAVTDEAKELMDKGVKLTAGMARDDGVKGLERFLATLPVVGNKIKGMQDEAVIDWNKYILDKATPYGSKGNAGSQGIQDAQDIFKRTYEDIWKFVSPDSIDLNRVSDTINNAVPEINRLPVEDQKAAIQALQLLEDDILRFMTDKKNVRLLDEMDDRLRNLGIDADSQITRDFYKTVRDGYRNALPERANKALSSVDKHYRDYKIAEKAASYVKAAENDNVFTPRQYQSAVKAKNSDSAVASGKAAGQKDANLANKTIASVMPERSQISMADDVGKWGTALAAMSNPPLALAGLAASPVMFNQTVRKAMTSGDTGEIAPAMGRMLRVLGLQGNSQDNR